MLASSLPPYLDEGGVLKDGCEAKGIIEREEGEG